MRAVAIVFLWYASLQVTRPLCAQDPPEKGVLHCNPADPRNGCASPGPNCPCSEDTLEVTFDGDTDSVLQYDAFVLDSPIETTVLMDVKSEQVQGWSYGVAHDDAFLTLLSVTVDGTAAEVAKVGGFVVAERNDIQTCGLEDPTCKSPRPAAGYISAVILSLTRPVVLPIQRNKICVAKYTLKADAGPNGTVVAVTNRLKKTNSPFVEINITAGGVSKKPTQLIDGWVKLIGEADVEVCNNGADDDGDGLTDCADRDCANYPGCAPVPEVCDNLKDDDLDGRADCDDRDCVNTTPCLPLPEVCDNGQDDDRDGRIDCDDGSCAEFPACRRENCGNGVDDDGDGAADCADEDCKIAIICQPEICDNGVDDNADAMADCHDQECREFPGCEPKPEICDNGEDEDFDGKIDCSDKDCMEADVCKPKPEICDNRQDDDRDGRVDCRDHDCDAAAACQPGPEVCDDCFDNDRDGEMDCHDSDCAASPICSPRAEVCDNLLDDDGDGAIDGADPDCPGGEALPLQACADYALYFGPAATTEDHVITGGGFAISMRNRSPALAFRLCVQRTVTGSSATYELASTLDDNAGPARALRILNDWGSLQSPATPNKARAPSNELVAAVERGSALRGFAFWDYLSSEIAPRSGDGLCFAADYVADLNLWGARNVIPPTRPGDPCTLNEILKIRTAAKVAEFQRGEVDGVRGISLTDAVQIIHFLVAGFRPWFQCQDALDVNDDGRVNITDPIVVLRFLFQAGESPAAPFQSCGPDPTPASAVGACTESNCR